VNELFLLPKDSRRNTYQKRKKPNSSRRSPIGKISQWAAMRSKGGGSPGGKEKTGNKGTPSRKQCYVIRSRKDQAGERLKSGKGAKKERRF